MQIHPVPRPPARDAEPHPLTRCIHSIEWDIEERDYGHHDFADSARARTVRFFGSENSVSLGWVALPDGVDPERARPGDGLGFATVILPLKEDLTTAIVTVGVRPQHQSQGIGRALFAVAEAELRARGRTLWQAYAFTPDASATGEHAVTAGSGSGSVDALRPAHRWLLGDGWRLEQCERPSTLVLGDHDALRERARALVADAHAAAGPDYVLRGWQDTTPAEFAEGVAYLMSRMSTDVPSGEMVYDEQHWDAARLAGVEEREQLVGISWVSAIAVHAPSGEPVAFNRLSWPEENPAGVWQVETLVRADHRGRRLGMLTKAANLARLVDANPQAARVHTWNAAENQWMLAINDALGFEPTGLEGAWQKRA